MSAPRRAQRMTVATGAPATYVPPPAFPTVEITYRGYLIEPASYCVNSVAWSPRVIVSVKTDEGWSPRAPLYASNAARFPTRPDADRSALDIARAWIDTTVDRDSLAAESAGLRGIERRDVSPAGG